MLEGAIIGFGNIVVRGHIPAYLSDEGLRSRVRIRAVLDVSEQSRPAARELLPDAAFYTDAGSLLENEKLDFVDICTPPSTHAGFLKEFAARGIHILCEKPLAESYAAALEASRHIREQKVVFVPCHQYKYSPLWRSIHQIISSGGIGSVVLAQCNVFRMQADTGTAGWNPRWRTDKAHGGGGILVDTGAHYFYLAQYLFGVPDSVSAVLRTLKHREYGVEDTALVTLEYGGMIMQLNLTWAAALRANSVTVVGTTGSLTYDGSRLVHVDQAGSREIPMPDVSDKNQYVGWYASLLKEFLDRVEQGNRSEDLLDEAVTVMQLLDLSAGASLKGCAVKIA
ncbi:MAG TPA: Gfo/Idh/MocA family oxidoreductase [Bacteroidota bacterium]|jgi:predicted dehydrogenase